MSPAEQYTRDVQEVLNRRAKELVAEITAAGLGPELQELVELHLRPCASYTRLIEGSCCSTE